MLQNCHTCARTFQGRKDAKYCSSRCRTQAHRQKSKIENRLADWPNCLRDKRSDYLAIQDISEKASETIKILYDFNGLQSARLAIISCQQILEDLNYG